MIQPRIDSIKAQAYLAFALKRYKRTAFSRPLVLGIRGYYLDSMGAKGRNERGIYDDAIVVVSPTAVAAFNGNTDPSAFRDGVASLIPGVHPYRPGNHGITRPGGGYPAFRPATKNEELPVMRDGQTKPSVGVAINIHRGGTTGTSSLGCQTIHPSQWDAFHALLTLELKRANVKVFDYVLVDEIQFREAQK